MLFTKYSVIRCPVCGQAGKNLNDVEKEEEIGCRFCGSKTRAARWTECTGSHPNPEIEAAKVRKELEEVVRYIKALAEAIDIPMDEVIRMMQE